MAGLIDGKRACLEFNTAVEKDGVRGWVNIGHWNDVRFEKDNNTTVFKTDHLTISFAGVGIEGACPAEKDNGGCFFLPSGGLRPPETITANKEFCDCAFLWEFNGKGASGKSIGATLPAVPTEERIVCPRELLTVENAAVIPCEQVLGAYRVVFERAD